MALQSVMPLDPRQSLHIMMTSSNGNIFRATGPLCGKFTGHRSQNPVTRSFDVFFELRSNKRLSKNNRETGDLRRDRAHHDVTVTIKFFVALCDKDHLWIITVRSQGPVNCIYDFNPGPQSPI